MARLVRWNPIREMVAMQNAMEQMFDDTSYDFPGTRRWTQTGSLAVDLAETDDIFVIKASLPGINPDNIDITMEEDVITIKTETKEEETVEDANFHLRECRFGSLTRSLRLPAPINADAIEATYEQGVLKLVAPKAESVKPKRIAVRSIING